MKKRSYDGLKATEVRPGVVRRSFSGAGATLAWTTLAPGHEPRPHTHPHEQIVYILSGRGRFCVGAESTDVEAGDVLVVPPGALHHVETIGEEQLVDLSVFNPRREDYFAADEPEARATNAGD
jgi:quercetin dioxygenase-like cupin family protein